MILPRLDIAGGPIVDETDPEEVILGLAVFGGIVAAVGRASPKVLLVSWTLGVVLVALRTVAGAARRAPRKLLLLKSEKARTVLLDPER